MVGSVARRRADIEHRHPVWRESTLDVYLTHATRAFGARPLVITDAITLSYDETLAQSLAIAAGLQAQGIGPGDRVGILLANFPIVVPLLFAIWRVGAVAVPFNTLNNPDEMAYVIRQSACHLLITMESCFGRNYLAEFTTLEPDWNSARFTTFPDLRGVIVLDNSPEPTSSFARFLNRGQAHPLPDESGAEPHAPAIILYTSGSTGSPKGVVQTHDNLLRAAYAGAYHQAFADGRRAIFSLPLYHSFGLVVGLLSGLVVGGAIIPLTRFDPARMLEAIGRHRATYLMAVPTMTIAMIEQCRRHPHDLSCLTAIHSAAAPTPSWVWRGIQQHLGCDEIFTSYGQTETTATIVCTQPGDPIEIVAATQGIIVQAGVAGIPGQDGRIAEFKTIDPETGADLPPGTMGELCTRGPMNAQGYFRRPEDTASIMLNDGWLRMGDLGQFLPDGNLLLTGRSKDLYKSRGELISPKEIEILLTGHADISQAFVVGVPSEQWGECGAAWLVLAAEAQISAAEVLAYLRPRLARHKLPQEVFFITAEDLPKTATGKVQKNRLRDMAIQRLGTLQPT